MRDDYQQFVDVGGAVAMVSMGSPAQVAAFRQQLRLPFPCLSDPGRWAYRAFGVPEGTVAQVAGPALWWAGFRALLRGGWGLPRGNMYQLPGAFVVDRQSVLCYVHRPVNSADYPDHAAMIAAIRRAASGS